MPLLNDQIVKGIQQTHQSLKDLGVLMPLERLHAEKIGNTNELQ